MNVKVVKKAPGKEAEIGSIENNYKALQNYVGGTFQCVSMPGERKLSVICNDDGKLLQMDANIFLSEYDDLVVGNILIAAHDDEGDMRDLTDAEIQRALKYCRENSAPYIDPDSDKYNSYLRVEFYVAESGKDEPDMGDD